MFPKKNILAFILITSLFALWAFANAITDPMVQAFKKVLELSNAEAAWVQMAFYGGYFIMALPAAHFAQKYSYKSGIILGLVLYAIGAFLFIPAANTGQFWFFCLGLYILTFGLSFIETTANPFVMSMGSEETATRRLNFSQAFNPLGLILGLLVAKVFVLDKLQSDTISDFSALSENQKTVIRTADLEVIRNPYVALGIFVTVLLLIIAATKMPERKPEGKYTNIFKSFLSLFKKKKYAFGVIAQLLYVGAQIMCWTYIYHYAENIGLSNSDASNYQFAAFILFFLGRALGTYCLKYIRAGKLLGHFALMAMGCTLITILTTNQLGLYALVSTSFFMSLMFPTIYGIALDKLPEDKRKAGSAGLVMAIVGGALLPYLQGMIIDLGGNNVNDITILSVPEVNISFALPLICFAVIALYGFKTRNYATSK